MIKKLPKLRGHGKNRARTVNSSVVKPTPINLALLEENFSNGDKVNPKTLVSVGLVDKKKGKIPKVKILGIGALSKKLEISNCTISGSAKAQVEKAGGKVEREKVVPRVAIAERGATLRSEK